MATESTPWREQVQSGEATLAPLGGYNLENGLGKATRTGSTGDCVSAGILHVRGEAPQVIIEDTKNPGVALRVPPEGWMAFIAAMRAGQLA